MNSKSFNSISAERLCNNYGYNINEINSHRSDNKITIQDVKIYHKIKLKSKMIGYRVVLIIRPYGSQEDIVLNDHNLNVLNNWFNLQIKTLNYAWPTSNMSSERCIFNHQQLIKLIFNVDDPSNDELSMSIESALDLDDDGNYPIYINNNQDLIDPSQNKKTFSKLKSTLISCQLIEKNITNIYQ
jgi:hypothetical protein